MICASPARCRFIGPENAPLPMGPHHYPPESDQEGTHHPTLDTTTTIQEPSHGRSQSSRDPYHPSCQQVPLRSTQYQLPRVQEPQTSLKIQHLQDKFKDVLEVRCNYQSFNCDLKSDKVNVKGRLHDHVQFWKDIGASKMMLSIIQEGYKIPFLDIPPPLQCRNNRSSLSENEFVSNSILELLQSGRITEKHAPSYIVSPLSVAYQACGRKRLILDLSNLNKFVQKTHFKLDDCKIGLQFLSKNALLFTFDLKSGYHHIDIEIILSINSI